MYFLACSKEYLLFCLQNLLLPFLLQFEISIPQSTQAIHSNSQYIHCIYLQVFEQPVSQKASENVLSLPSNGRSEGAVYCCAIEDEKVEERSQCNRQEEVHLVNAINTHTTN